MSVRAIVTGSRFGHDLGFACTTSAIRGPTAGREVGGRVVDEGRERGQRLGYPNELVLDVGQDPPPAIYLSEAEFRALRKALRRRTVRLLLRGERP
jgi:hypothetical protein